MKVFLLKLQYYNTKLCSIFKIEDDDDGDVNGDKEWHECILVMYAQKILSLLIRFSGRNKVQSEVENMYIAIQ